MDSLGFNVQYNLLYAWPNIAVHCNLWPLPKTGALDSRRKLGESRGFVYHCCGLDKHRRLQQPERNEHEPAHVIKALNGYLRRLCQSSLELSSFCEREGYSSCKRYSNRFELPAGEQLKRYASFGRHPMARPPRTPSSSRLQRF